MGEKQVGGSCGQCGAQSASGARFCDQCGAALGRDSPKPAESAERKQVSVLFADLTGFTALTEKLDPEETRRIMGAIFEQAAEIVQRHDGRIEKFVGDAIMAIFGVPLAHEDDPHRAVRAAMQLHEAVATLSPEIAARSGVELSMHSGVNTGVVVTGELQIDHGTAGPLGDTINTAARLMNAAPSGQIWIGPETARLVAAEFELADQGEIKFKGKTQLLSVASVTGARGTNIAPVVNKFQSTFVGRQAELGALLGAAEKIRDGQPQAFGVCGEAGSGKTRLVSEFRHQLGDDVQWLEGRAYSYSTDIPFGPLLDLMRRIWRVEGSDGPAQLQAKVQAGIETLFGPNSDVLPLFLHLFDLDQMEGEVIERESFPDQLFVAMQRVSAGLSERAPSVICFQDLHWSDPSTIELIAKLAANPGSPVMLLANYRPGYNPPTGMHELSLGELSPRQSGEMLASLLDGEVPDGLAQFVTDRCDGNPFYVEEVVNSLSETGLLIHGELGWALAGPLTESSVPATIRGVIAARIDRLDDGRRRLLREAAVVGREFLVKIVELVGSNIDELTAGLHQLQDADLIRQGRLEPSLAYMFKHALTQDVAYEGLLMSDRQMLHVRTATAMEKVFTDRVGEYVETLAYHFQRGGDVDKATHYLIEAGTKCLNRYALTEAEKHFRDAYAIRPAGELTQQQLHTQTRLLVNWAQLHYYLGTISEWNSLFEKHLPEAEQCGDDALLASYLGWLGNARQFCADMVGSLEILNRGHALAEAAGDAQVMSFVSAYRIYGLGEQRCLAEAVALGQSVRYTPADVRNEHFRYVKGRSGLALALGLKGDLAQSRAISEELIETGRASGNSRALALGHSFLSWHWLFALDFKRAAAVAQAGLAGAKDPLYRAMCVDNLAMSLATDFQAEPVLALTQEWLPYCESNGNEWFGSHLRASRDAANMMSGKLSDGLRGYLSTLDSMRSNGALCSAAMGEALTPIIYAAIARHDVKPSAKALLANPWFVFKQAPFAARNARAAIAKTREMVSRDHLDGLSSLIDLADGRLAIHQRKIGLATENLERIRQRLRDNGIDQDSAPVASLADEIAAKR